MKDTANKDRKTHNFNLDAAQTSPALVMRVFARTGYSLKAETSLIARLEARGTGSGAAFADVAAAPIDLTPDAGSFVDFDVRAIAFSPMQRTSDEIRLYVART